MNIYSLFPLMASLINFCVVILILIKGARNLQNFALVAISILGAIWYFGFFIMLNLEQNLILKVARFAIIGAVLYPVPFSIFYLNFMKLRTRNLLLIPVIIVTLVLLFILLFKTSLFVNGVYKYPWGFYPKAATGEIVTMIFSALIAVFLIIRFLGYMKTNFKTMTSAENNRTKYIFYSLFFASLLLVDYAPKCGINVYPYVGPSAYIFFITILTYATIKHKLLDINIVVRKSVIYSLLITIITLLYFFLVLFYCPCDKRGNK